MWKEAKGLIGAILLALVCIGVLLGVLYWGMSADLCRRYDSFSPKDKEQMRLTRLECRLYGQPKGE